MVISKSRLGTECRGPFTGIYNGTVHQGASVTSCPWVGGTAQSVFGVCYSKAVEPCGNMLSMTGTCSTERGEGRVLAYSPPVHLLTPESTTSPSQPVRLPQAGQISKVVATSAAKDQTTRLILVEVLSIQVPTKYQPFQP